MKRWVLVLSCSAAWFAGSSTVAFAEEDAAYDLRPRIAVGDQTKVDLALSIVGRIQVGSKEADRLDVRGKAKLVFPERVLSVGEDGLPEQVVRFYEDARAKFVVGASEDARQLRPRYRLVAGRRDEHLLSLWSPVGPLTGDERELIEEAFDVTRLAGLLPSEPVEVGDKWAPSESVMQSLCDLQQFVGATVECELEKVDDRSATIHLEGDVTGLAFGAEFKSRLEATLEFDLLDDRLTEVRWAQVDQRSASPVSPAGSYEVAIHVRFEETDSEYLAGSALKRFSLEPTPKLLSLVQEMGDEGVRFSHDRDWHVTAARPDRLVLRRMEGPKFLAQLSVFSLDSAPAGKSTSPEHFERLITSAAGYELSSVERVDTIPLGGPHQVQLVRAIGADSESPLVQRHYLVTDPSGRQALFSYLVPPQLESELDGNDLRVVSSVEFLDLVAGRDGESRR